MELEVYLEKVKSTMLRWIDNLGDSYITNIFQSIESGKMVRSQLMFYIAGERADEVIPLSSIIELVHLASLLHDDVIDNSDIRRGKPSVNATDGSKIAVMIGDILYSKAFVELGKYNQEIIEQVANAVVKLSIGEISDVNLAKHFNNDEKLYLEMIYNKTASLIETSTKVSALAVDKDGEKFGEYGKGLGMAFQIIDDILDITQTSEQLGKPALNDFTEGKTTLPYIYLFKYLEEEEERKILVSFHNKRLNESEKKWLFDKFEESQAVQKAYQLAEEYSYKALHSLPEENKKLVSIVHKLISRSS